MRFDDYLIEESGVVLCQPCLCIAVFSSAELTQADPAAILGPYRAFLDEFSDSLAFARIGGDQMHATKLKQEDIEAWPKWVSDPQRRSRGGYGVELRSGKSRDEWVSPCLEVENSKIGNENTYYRICVPLAWLSERQADGVEDYLIKSLSNFPLQSGYVGYSFAWEMSSPRALDVTEGYFHHWLQRHPGIMAPAAGSQSSASALTLTDVGWITLLGEAFVARMGGQAEIEKAVSDFEGVEIKQLGSSGLMLRVGKMPRLGDVDAGDALEDYRKVGNFLSPLRDKDALLRNMVIHGLKRKHFPKEREKWLDRFF